MARGPEHIFTTYQRQWATRISFPSARAAHERIGDSSPSVSSLAGVLPHCKFEFEPESSSPLLSARGGFVRAARIDRMQKKPDDAMEEEAAPAPAPGPEIGFWLAARRRLAPEDPFFAAGDLERELLAKHVRLIPLPLSSSCPRYTHADPCCKRVGTACLGRFSFPWSLGVMQIPVRASQF